MSFRLLPRLASTTRVCAKTRSQRLAVASGEEDKNPAHSLHPHPAVHHQRALRISPHHQQGARHTCHEHERELATPSAYHQAAIKTSSPGHHRTLHTTSAGHKRALQTFSPAQERALHTSSTHQQRSQQITLVHQHRTPHTSAHQDRALHTSPADYERSLPICSTHHHHNVLRTSPAHQQNLHTSIQDTHAIQTASAKEGSLEIGWVGGDGEDAWLFPYPWLRENCPCPSCYDTQSLTRLLTLEDWDLHDAPVQVQVCNGGGGVEVKWKSGHQSHYKADWLRAHGFTDRSRKMMRSMMALKKELWAHHLDISRHTFASITATDEGLLDFLVELERVGVVLVTGAPREPKAAFKIVNKIGFPKQTHYGIHYPIRNKPGANSLAYTDNKLGMHNDLPYFNYVPGIIFLHCITQFEGEGGENDLADGYFVAQYLRDHHPEQYHILSSTPVYFFNKGKAMVEQETTEFYKIFDTAIIVEDPVSRKVVRLNFSQLRHSYFDVPPEKVTPWYSALRLFHDTMHQHAIRRKLNSGEMLVMDNTRLLHGRTAYNGALGERYMDQVYLDWDVALSKRRVLQEKLEVHIE